MSHPLHHEVLKHQVIRARLVEAFPDLDEETLVDTLEGATDLKEMLAGIARAYLEDRCMVSALKQRLEAMRDRLGRLENTASRKRDLITEVMEKAELQKLTEPDFTLSMREVPPSVQVVEEAEVPEQYWKPQPAKLDRQALLAALKQGQAVPGALLSNGGRTVSLRTK